MPVLAEGANTAEFVKDLITNIATYPDDIDSNPILDLTNPTLKSYFNGTRSISKTASKINKFIDDEKFINYINSASDGAVASICTELTPYCPGINNFNTAEICATLFKSILLESANTSKNKKATPAKCKSDQEAKEAKLEDKYGVRLLVEANGTCQNDNCCQPLYVTNNRKSTMSYKITQINPSLPSYSFENLIALCPKCNSKYILSANDADIKRMNEIKKTLMDESDARETLSDSKVEDGVDRVLRKLQNTSQDELVPLN